MLVAPTSKCLLTKGCFRAFFYGSASELEKICRLGLVCKVESIPLQIIVGATRHLQHILFLAANTILFAVLAEKYITLHARWQPSKMTKKHPAPPPRLTYNG
jgi:hypothetical protein